MKKIILTAALILGFAVAASAQPRAIGVRIGDGAEVSYQHYLGNNFLELDGGLDYAFDETFSVGATGIYNFMISEFENGWNFYAGPGAGVGLCIGETNYFALSAAGMVGVEYNFKFPLQISFDFKQHIGIGFNGNGIWTPSSIGLGLRYKF